MISQNVCLHPSRGTLSSDQEYHLLITPDTLVNRRNHIHPQHKAHRLPGVPIPVVPVLHNPVERDETIMDPVELKQDGEEHDDGGVDEKGIERAFERDGVFEEGDFDGDPWSVSVYS